MKIRVVVRSVDGTSEPEMSLYDMPSAPRVGDTIELNRFGTVAVTAVTAVSWTPEPDDNQDAVVVTEL